MPDRRSSHDGPHAGGVHSAADLPSSRRGRWRFFGTVGVALVGSVALVVLWRVPAGLDPGAVGTTTTEVAANPVVTTTTTTVPEAGPVFSMSGALPDGTRFNVYSHGGSLGPLEIGSAAIAVDDDQGVTHIVGLVEYLTFSIEFRDYGPGYILLPAGEWTIRIDVLDAAADLFGSDPVQALMSGVSVWWVNDMPALELAAPLRWATDAESPVPMQMAFGDLMIKRGCGENAFACSETRALQVASVIELTADIDDEVGINAYSAPRPTDDAGYLNPGPLNFRWGAYLVWTGSRLIVWGGTNGNGDAYTDGAIFDPVSGSWGAIPGPPLVGPDLTAAVWAGDHLIVVTRQATFSYDLDANEWVWLGEGPLYVTRSPGLIAWTGERVVMWAPLGIYEFDPTEGGQWSVVPDVGFGGPDRWRGVLRLMDGRVFAVASCWRIAEWDGAEWHSAPPAPRDFDDDCNSSFESGVVGGRLMLWSGPDAAFAFDPSTWSWAEVAAPPLPGGDGWEFGGVDLGGRLLLPVGQTRLHYDDTTGTMREIDSLLYDPTADSWEPVSLPGVGDEVHMVWTGDEVLSWGGCCWGAVVDAWRWKPKPPAG